MSLFRRPPSAVLRSALALLLVCAQIFAAAHALSHVGELSAQARFAAASPASREGGLPAAERHERCLLCLAAADLAAALPPALPLLAAAALPPSLPGAAAFAPRASRLPRPPARGPPVLPV